MSGNLTRAEAAARSAAISDLVVGVSLDLTGAVDAETLTFPVTSRIEFISHAPETFLEFAGESVDAVTVDGAEVPIVWEGERIRLGGLPGDGSRIVVEVSATGRYSRTGQGLHRFVDPADGETYLYTHFEPDDAHRLYPCADQPDLKMRLTLEAIAPAHWRVMANGSVRAREEDGDVARWSFTETLPVSSYLTAVVAGPYAGEEAEWTAPDGSLTVPLGVWCRASLREHLDVDELLTVTRQGLDWYHANFGAYPWGDYQQVFVPEYNIGAMENPGCVTFNEHYVFRSTPTRAQLQGRANTILHEMCHMWFGDLVTPRWWDDLWLKESFAEFMGAHVSVEATRYTEAWAAFSGRRLDWALQHDQYPTTHPIAADVPDLAAARQNFDGITYAKGAAVLRQLVAFVGLDAFLAGSREYFRRHAFGAASMADLLACLEEASGRELDSWVRAWIETSRPDTFTFDRASGVVRRDAPDDTRRPHRLAVGLYRGVPLELAERVEVELVGDGVEVPFEVRDGDVVLVNDGALTYVKVRLDDLSASVNPVAIARMTDPLAQTLLLSAEWQACRDGATSPHVVLERTLAVARALPAGSPGATSQLGRLLSRALFVVDHYAAVPERVHLLAIAGEMLAQESLDDEFARLWADAYAEALAGLPADALMLETPAEAFPRERFGTPDLRWKLLFARAARGEIADADLDAALAEDPTGAGRIGWRAASTARPAEQVKRDAWRLVYSPGALANEEVDAVVRGLTVPGQRALTEAFDDAYWDGLLETWTAHPMEIATRLVRGLFPQTDADGDPAYGVARARAWLDEAGADAPTSLRRLILEQLDEAERAVSSRVR